MPPSKPPEPERPAWDSQWSPTRYAISRSAARRLHAIPPASHCFYGVDGNGVPVGFAGDGDFLAGYVLHLVLIGDGVDFALFRHEHGGRSALNAALRAGLVAPHFLLAGAILIDDVAAEIGRHRGNACQ